MKKISHVQSRRNAARRRRKVATRHARAGHWAERPVPMLTSGRIGYEVGGNVEATCFGGIAAVHQIVTRLGLPARIDESLRLLKVHLPYHESDHVLNLAYNVLCGGTRLEDIERLRHDVAYMNALGADLIPDPTTAGDFCRRFTEADVVTLMEAINTVRARLWASRGADLLGPVAYIDIDGTIVPTDGKRKAGLGMSYKGIWGYAPLLVSLANTREELYLVNRPGNAPSHQDAAVWIDKAIDLVAPHAPRVCLRGDTDFSLTAHLDRWADRVDFVLGMDANSALRSQAQALPESAWTRLQRPAPYQNQTGKTRARRPDTKAAIVAERGYLNLSLDFEDVAEFTYRPGKCTRAYRIVVLRKNISRSRGDQALFDEIRYFFYVTTYPADTHTPAQIVALANQRCDQENIIGCLKSGINALRVPLYDLVSNWAYMVIAALAWNLKSWFALMMHRKTDRHTYIRMEFRRFFHHIILIPAMVIRRARAITVRIIGYTPSLDRLFSVATTTERIRFG
ncbi:MAG TPA: IS1380 family transposase [Candidatus Limnocylindrales bacterium]|nr:IS1380 family transposase [Candidatus Limnocylindrales bacterium]